MLIVALSDDMESCCSGDAFGCYPLREARRYDHRKGFARLSYDLSGRIPEVGTKASACMCVSFHIHRIVASQELILDKHLLVLQDYITAELDPLLDGHFTLGEPSSATAMPLVDPVLWHSDDELVDLGDLIHPSHYGWGEIALLPNLDQ
jgi:hypothetical protein